MPEFRRPMKAGEAIYRAITGLSPRSEGKTTMARTRDAVARLIRAGQARTVGEAKKVVAALAGVSLRTVQKWYSGRQEAKNTARAANADALARAQRIARVKDGRANLLRSSGGGDGFRASIKIYGRVRVSSDDRQRWINPDIPQEDLDALIDKVIDEGPDAAGEMLNQLLGTHYVPGMTIDDIEEIRYE